MEGHNTEHLLHEIASDFPEKLEEISEFREMKPPVSEEYLLELCGDDPELIELFEEMIEYFYRYTHDVCEQESLIKKGLDENLAEIQERDGPRTSLHNAMIDSVKILARNLVKRGKDGSWIAPIDKKSRAGYAQLALLTTFQDLLKVTSNEN